MGTSSWSGDAYRHLGSTRSKSKDADIFTAKTVTRDMDPVDLKVRESRDSTAHPKSLAVILALDVTGSMGMIPSQLVRGALANMMDTMYAHNIPDPQVMPVAIGDHYVDCCPLQIGQFESGNAELDKWLTSFFLERGGGGQHYESYPLAWLVAARHTSVDCWEKRGEKGFLFTVGDEAPWSKLEAETQKKLLGYAQPEDISIKDLLEEVSRSWNVFHVHIQEGTYRDDPRVFEEWRQLLGERFLVLDNYQNLAELIASTVAIVRGVDRATVTAGLTASAAKSVSTALAKVGQDLPAATGSTGMLTF